MRLVFQHIAKTAGTTISGYFIGVLGADNIYTHAIGQVPDPHYRFYTGHFGPQDINNIRNPKIVFTFLRDPVDRVISLYRFWMLRVTGPDHQMLVHENGFEDFIGIDHPGIQDEFCNGMVKQLGGDLDAAKATLEKMVHIGFQETFEDSMTRLRRKLGMPPPKGWPKINENDEMIERLEMDIPTAQDLEAHRDRLEDMNRDDRKLYEWARARF